MTLPQGKLLQTREKHEFDKSGEFKMTHQATANIFNHGARRRAYFVYQAFEASVLVRICFFLDVRTPCLKIMTSYSSVAWWVNKSRTNSVFLLTVHNSSLLCTKIMAMNFCHLSHICLEKSADFVRQTLVAEILLTTLICWWSIAYFNLAFVFSKYDCKCATVEQNVKLDHKISANTNQKDFALLFWRMRLDFWKLGFFSLRHSELWGGNFQTLFLFYKKHCLINKTETFICMIEKMISKKKL